MRKKFKLGSLKPGVVKTVKKIIDESKAKKQDKARVKKMGGGMMMGRRFGMKKGMSVKGDDKRDIRKTESMTGASKSSKREKGKTKFGMLSVKAGIDKNPNPTLADRIAGAKMKKRMQAKEGTKPFNEQKSIIDKQGKRGIIVGTGTMDASPKVKTTKRKSDRSRKIGINTYRRKP